MTNYPSPVQHNHPDTSHTAAMLHPLIRTGIRARVAEHLKANVYGLTDDEVHELGTGTRHRHSTATRRGELCRAGLVGDTGRRRPNVDGNLEVVWRWIGDGEQLDLWPLS